MSKSKIWIPGQKNAAPKVRFPQPGDTFFFRPAAAPPTDADADDDAGIAEKALLVQFACGSRTLAGRKMCTGYVKDEADTKFEDCAGLRHPETKERTGLCWNMDALFQKSASFMRMVESITGSLINAAPPAEAQKGDT